MPIITTTVASDVCPSFRVQQIAGLFDLPLQERSVSSFTLEIPASTDDWSIGLITGPSGSGKTTLAREAFGADVYQPASWPATAMIDGLGEHPIKTITRVLTSVGLGSPPTWVRPYAVLSNGEKFRADLARALLGEQPTTAPRLVVFDEFTSVVDRTVAKIASAAVAKSIRAGRLPVKFVAVTCHRDIAEWLEPDWMGDAGTGQLTRGRLRRPQIVLRVVRCRQALWGLFSRHHYLSGGLSRGSTCYAAVWNDEPVAFCAVVAQFGKQGCKRISRLVTLPDYQGLGIGLRLAERAAEVEQRRGFRVTITASHPAMIAACRHSPRWQERTGSRTTTMTRQYFQGREIPTSLGRLVTTFEWGGRT